MGEAARDAFSLAVQGVGGRRWPVGCASVYILHVQLATLGRRERRSAVGPLNMIRGGWPMRTLVICTTRGGLVSRIQPAAVDRFRGRVAVGRANGTRRLIVDWDARRLVFLKKTKNELFVRVASLARHLSSTMRHRLKRV